MSIISRQKLKALFDEECAGYCAICIYSDKGLPCKLIDKCPEAEPPEWQYEFFKKLYLYAKKEGLTSNGSKEENT